MLNINEARAADGIWTNLASGGLWSDTANWSGGGVGDGSSANFSTLNLTANSTVLFDAPRTLTSLSFGDTASTYYNWTLNNNGNANNVLTLAGTLPSITVNTGFLTNNVVIAGTGGLKMVGAAATSSLVLGASNTFSGDVHVSTSATAGTYWTGLYLNNAGALGGSSSSSTIYLDCNAANRAALYLNTVGSNIYSNNLVMRPAVASSRAEFHVSMAKSTNIWNGNILCDGIAGQASALSDIYVDAASSVLTINGNITATSGYIGNLDLRGTTEPTTAGFVNGSINIGGTLGKNDAGTWTLKGGNNTWSNTTVIAGTLKLGIANALPINAPITIGGGAAVAYLDLNGFSQTLSNNVTHSGSGADRITNSISGSPALLIYSNTASASCGVTIGGNISLLKSGVGVLTLSAANTYKGDTVISNGTLALTASGAISASTNIIIGSGATFSPTSFSLGASQKLNPVDGTATTTGTINVGSGTLVLNYVKDSPALVVSGGNLSLSSSSMVVINVTGSLVAGQTYQLVSVISGGQVSGTMPASVILNGAGGLFGSLVVSNSQLYLIMDTKPIIASQLPNPYTNLFTLFAGASPSFSVTAGGLPPFGYKWFTNGVLDETAISSSMVWKNVQAGNSAAYCIVTNASGSATSTAWSASVIAAPTATYPLAVLSNGPIGYWRLNESDDGLGDNNASVIAHDYIGGNNALYTNTILGQPGYSQSTDSGTTSALFGYVAAQNTVASGIMGVDFAAPNNSSKAFTVEAWVSGYTPISDSGIVAKGYGNGGEQFSLDTGGPGYGYRFFVRDATGASHVAASSVVANYGVWNHLVGICDEPNGAVRLYVDGRLVASATIGTNGGIFASTSLMSIGARYTTVTSMANNTYDNEFAGYINDVAVYDYALTASQVTSQYSAAGIAPFFISEPVASTTVNQNGTLTASGVVVGTEPLSYSWFDVNAGRYIVGQTNATLVITNLQAGDSYYLTALNSFGSINSSTITVGVVSGLNVSMVPSVSSLSLYSGIALNFAVTASGNEPFYFHWYTNGVSVSSATNANYVLTVPLGIRSVSCQVSNSYNGLSSQTLGPVSVTGVLAPTNNYQVTVLSNTPVAYWPLSEVDSGLSDGNAGVVARDYVGGHNGTYANATLGLPGFDLANNPLLTSALFGVFAPTNSLVVETDNSAYGLPKLDFARPTGSNAQFSVEVWVNCTNANQVAGIVAKGSGHSEQFAMDVYNGGFRFVIRDAAGVSHDSGVSDAPSVGRWYHLVGVWDGASGAVRLFVNGANVRNLTGLATGIGLWTPSINDSLPGAGLVNIGSRASSTTTNVYDIQFKGEVANVALYDYTLSTNQVAAHYYSATNLPPVVIVTPGVLTVSNLNNGQLQLVWGFSGSLQSAASVAGPYDTVTNAASPYTLTATNSQMFYRIKQQ